MFHILTWPFVMFTVLEAVTHTEGSIDWIFIFKPPLPDAGHHKIWMYYFFHYFYFPSLKKEATSHYIYRYAYIRHWWDEVAHMPEHFYYFCCFNVFVILETKSRVNVGHPLSRHNTGLSGPGDGKHSWHRFVYGFSLK